MVRNCALFLRCPWRDIRHASRDGGEGRRGADGYPNAKGVPCDVPPVLMKWEGWGEREFVKGEVQINVEIVIIWVYNVERKLV